MMKQSEAPRKIFGICLAIVTAIVAAQFIIQIWLLYLSGGETPYTVESISKHFAMIKGYWAWLVLVIVGGFAFENPKDKIVVAADAGKTLKRLQARLPRGTETVEMRKLRLAKKLLCIGCAVICTAVSVCILLLMYNESYQAAFAGEFFKSHTEAEKLIWVAAMSLAALGCCVAAVYLNERDTKQELALVKEAIAENAKQGLKAEKQERVLPKILSEKWSSRLDFLRSERGVLWARIVLGVVALICIVKGIDNGGMASVLEKAVQICTQCIGLG